MAHPTKELFLLTRPCYTKQVVSRKLHVLLIGFVIILLNVITQKNTTAAPAEKENSSGSSEEGGSSIESDFVYSLLHAAMNNLTIRANKIHPTSSPIIMDPLALAPPITLVYNTTYFTSPLGNATNLGTIEDDDFDYEAIREWKTKDTVEGYEISSDSGLQFKSKLLKDKKLIHIRVDITTAAWTLATEIHRRNLDLKIMTWERTNRIRIKVPYGAMPDELKVDAHSGSSNYIDVFAPYGFLVASQGQEQKQ